MTQVPITPTAGSAVEKSPSHECSRLLSPTAPSSELIGPGRVVQPLPGHADHHRRQHLRQEDDGANGGAAPHASMRHQRRQEQPDRDRQHRVEPHQHQRVAERLPHQRVDQRLAVVGQAHPVPDRDAVPRKQRDPGAVDHGRDYEHAEHHQRRQHVQVADQPRLAGGGLGARPAPPAPTAPLDNRQAGLTNVSSPSPAGRPPRSRPASRGSRSAAAAHRTGCRPSWGWPSQGRA